MSEIWKRPDLPSTISVIRGAGWSLGYVDIIHGPEGDVCNGFLATRHELRVLAHYWAKKHYEIHRACSYYQQVGSSEMRLDCYSGYRLREIEKLLGEEVMEAIRREAEEEVSREWGGSGSQSLDLSASSDSGEKLPPSSPE